jgi:transposase
VVKIGELMMILDLHRQGLSVAAIARETGKDAKTIRRYIAHGLEPPVYGPRPPQACRLDPYKAYLQERITAYPQLSGRRLLREVRDLGYDGGYTAITDFLRTVRPPATLPFEVRFETPPGRQAQVDFAQFQVIFADDPEVTRIVGCSRWCSARAAGCGRASSCIRTCRRFCAATSRRSPTSAACRRKSSTTG